MDVPLRLPPEEMRTLGYRAVDAVVNHLEGLTDRPVGQPPDRRALENLFGGPAPDAGSDAMAVLNHAVEAIGNSIVHTDHPRFLAYVPGPSNYVSVLADFLASGLNVYAGQWLVGSGPAVVERTVIGWLTELCGLPDKASGLFVSGGTMASLVAIHAARVRLDPATVAGAGLIYVTNQTHRSITKGLLFLGFDSAQIRLVGVDRQHRMSVDALQEQIVRDRRDGLRPFCVVATAGATSTGAVDPLDAIADVCGIHDMWLHVDGAYGAAAVLSNQGEDLLAGLGRADSIALDPHKWWYQPYEAGCVLVKDETALLDAFSMQAEYLRETRHGDQPLNYYDLGPQLTRSFRALKMWMSVRTFGLDSFRRAIAHSLHLAEHAQMQLESRVRWEVVTPAQLAIVTFRPAIPDAAPETIDAVTRRVAAASLVEGYALVTTTEVDTRPVLRFCMTHPQTTKQDIESVLDHLERLVEAHGRSSGNA